MGHYYQQLETEVIPMHFVEMASRPGELRPTRITDVKRWRKEGKVVVPSVTTIIDILAKPQLNNWIVDQHLKIALQQSPYDYVVCDKETYPFGIPEDEDITYDYDKYIKEVKRLTELQMDIAPSAGSDLHKSLESYFDVNLREDHPDYKICLDVYRVIKEKTGHGHLWETEIKFVYGGYGGQVDLCNECWIIDYKTKQSKDKFKPGKMAFLDHKMQLAAYRKGLGLPKAKCANVFVCLEDGQIDFHEHTESDLEMGWEVFKRCLEIWQFINEVNYERTVKDSA